MEEAEELVDAILESQKEFIGERQAVSTARKSSLKLNSEGDIIDYYGSDETAVELLLKAYYDLNGQAGLNYTKKYLDSKDMKLPEGLDIPARETLMDRILIKIRNSSILLAATPS